MDKPKDLRRFLITTSKETFRITVPETWKVTFGPGHPPNAKRGYDFDGGQRGWCLRFYEAENRQRACFVGVVEFRDLDLPLERLVVTEKGESSWVHSESVQEERRKIEREKKFVKEGHGGM